MLRKATIALSAILGIGCGCALLASVGGSKTYSLSPEPFERYRIAVSGGWLSVAGVRLTPEFFEPKPSITDAVYRDGTHYGNCNLKSDSSAASDKHELEVHTLFLALEPVEGASLLVPEVSSQDLGGWRLLEFLFAVRLPLWMPTVAFLIYPVVAFLRGPVRRHKRRKSGRCPRCGYDLTGNATGVCPECGREFASNR
ncbi:MAG: hypothetical protein IID36_11300 [Planctomycetes bacterium]|nr:hypothetical protein [Planctomycetota bacterium]